MAEIKLNYTQVVALVQNMNNSARNFLDNQTALRNDVSALNSSWSGNAATVMQRELNDMNRNALEIQKSLLGMAEFVQKAAELLKETDSGVAKGVSSGASSAK